ncbi:chemotaxis protein CheW [Caldimonas sp. KR1-144]|uniref:chemotaxis protein CheW n=1 Tax=Caldimonas sp. KR1-144 TaxID=3400911 RepID=UPI003C01A226
MSRAALALDDCWNRIGVRGDRSCPELERHVHCRNCPVQARAAKQLLQRAAPAGYLDEASAHYASAHDTSAHHAGVPPDSEAGERSALAFRVGAEWLALSCTLLDEVTETRAPHALPHRRSGALLGLVNVRGELLACVSIAQLLDIGAGAAPPSQRSAAARLLVLRHEQGRLACPVDEVHGVLRFDARRLQPPPSTVTRAAARYTQALLPWEQRTVGILDEPLLLHSLGRSLA